MPVKLSAVKVKQLLMTDKADMRGEKRPRAALDARRPEPDPGRLWAVWWHVEWKVGPEQVLRGLRTTDPVEVQAAAVQAVVQRVRRSWARSRRARARTCRPDASTGTTRLYFKSFERASKKTKTIDTVEDMEGFAELKEADKADLTPRVAAWVARKAAMNANYKPKKRKRRGGDWLPSPTNPSTTRRPSIMTRRTDNEEEADERPSTCWWASRSSAPVVARSPHDEGAAELLAALAGSPPPPSNAAAPSSAVS